MQGLDFWATDAETDRVLPMFDTWSTNFMLAEWARELQRDEILFALASAGLAYTTRRECLPRGVEE